MKNALLRLLRPHIVTTISDKVGFEGFELEEPLWKHHIEQLIFIHPEAGDQWEDMVLELTRLWKPLDVTKSVQDIMDATRWDYYCEHCRHDMPHMRTDDCGIMPMGEHEYHFFSFLINVVLT